MKDPPRLLEGAGEEQEVALLRSAMGDGPAPRSRAKALVALGVGGSLAGASAKASGGAAATVVAKAGGLTLLKWVAIGAVGGAVTLGVAKQIPEASSPPPPLPAVVAPPVLMSATAPKPEGEGESVVAQASASAEPQESAPRLPPPPSGVPSPEQPSLMQEVAALDRVREAVAQGNGALALERLEQHRRDFPKKRLGPEATVLRIEALSSMGRKAEARTLANQFLSRHPTSPHASRIRSLVEPKPIP